MNPFEADIHRTVAVLEGMRMRYTEAIPEVYLKHFTADLNHRVTTAERPLYFIDQYDHRD